MIWPHEALVLRWEGYCRMKASVLSVQWMMLLTCTILVSSVGEERQKARAWTAVSKSVAVQGHRVSGRLALGTTTDSGPTVSQPMARPAASRDLVDDSDGAVVGEPKATFSLLRTVRGPWHLPDHPQSPWSPGANMLALHGPKGLYVLDTSSEGSEPRLVLSGRVVNYSWSPDGRWLLGVLDVGSHPRHTLRRLVVAPVEGEESVFLLESASIGTCTWGHDGRLYYWDDNVGMRQAIAPPKQWRELHSEAFEARPTYVLVAQPGANLLQLHKFSPGLGHEAAFPSDTTNLNTMRVMLDVLADGRVLLWIYDYQQSPYAVITDANGNVLCRVGSDVDEEGFGAHAFTADGRFVVGHDTSEDGDDITEARLFVRPATGGKRIPIAGGEDGMGPRVSHYNTLMAYRSLKGEIRIGKLQIDIP